MECVVSKVCERCDTPLLQKCIVPGCPGVIVAIESCAMYIDNKIKCLQCGAVYDE